MIVRNFLQWAMTASAAQRSEGAGALARAYLYSELDERTRRDAEIAMMSLLDDPSPLVRRALADNFASAADAPHSLISALANDQSDIAAPTSVAFAAALRGGIGRLRGDRRRLRPKRHRPARPRARQRRGGARRSRRARGGDFARGQSRRGTRRIFDAAHDRAFRRRRRNARSAALASLAPGDDPQPIGRGGGRSLTAFVVDCAWLSPERAERLSREARDKANVIIVAETAARDGRAGLRELAAHLRASGQLTPSLVLRASAVGAPRSVRGGARRTVGPARGSGRRPVARFSRRGLRGALRQAGLPTNSCRRSGRRWRRSAISPICMRIAARRGCR